MTIKEILMPLYLEIVNNKARLNLGFFLDNRFIETKYIFISVWSLVHFLMGGFIYFLLDNFTKIKSTRVKFLILFILLLAYEVVEYFLYTNFSLLFIPETPIDVIWDMIIGMFGGFVVYLFGRLK